MELKERYDVVIAGAGAGGLYTALSLPETLSVLVLAKKDRKLSNSSLAQGGVAAVLSFENDSFDLHFKDTMIAGQYKNDPDAVNVLVHEGPDDVRKIMAYGVDFDKNPDGSLQKTLEGGHCRRRIVHHKDTTGAEIVDKLLAEVSRRGNITLCEDAMVFSLQKVKSGFCVDMLIEDAPQTVFCDYCVLATGGIGRVYKYTTNPAVAILPGGTVVALYGADILPGGAIMPFYTHLSSPRP